MQGEHWTMIAGSCQNMYFADSLGGFYLRDATFHLCKFRQEEITGIHDVNVLSFISSYM